MAMHFWAVAQGARAAASAPHRSEPWGYAAGLMTWIIAGTVFVAVKAGVDQMPPWSMCFFRSLLSALVLLPLVASHRREMTDLLRRRWLEALFIGAIGLGLTQGVTFTALSYTTAVNVGIVFALAPLITMVLARVLLGEPMGPWQGVGSLIAFCGIVVISVQGSLARLRGFDFAVGELIALGAALLFAGYTVLLKRAKFGLSPMPLLVILLTAGSLASLPFFLAELWNGEHVNLATKGYLALLYCGVIGGAVMYLLYNASLDVLGATRAGTLIYTQMIFVTFFAWLILGETIEWYHLVGGGLVICGVLLVVLLKPKPAARPA